MIDALSAEKLVRAFHATRPGETHAAWARVGSYELLASMVSGRVLDLACGSALMPGAVGLDSSREELSLASGARVQGRAQELPFRDQVFDGVVCHLGFMLFDDVESVVREVGRVLVPGGTFVALLGGGPTSDGHDAFHAFLDLAKPCLHGALPGDRRAKSLAGWRELFAGWREPRFERVVLDLGGSFDEVWTFLGASYQLASEHADTVRAALRAQIGERSSCRVVAWVATVAR